jgi:hypothetical protein
MSGEFWLEHGEVYSTDSSKTAGKFLEVLNLNRLFLKLNRLILNIYWLFLNLNRLYFSLNRFTCN